MSQVKDIANAILVLQEAGIDVGTGDVIEKVYKKLCADTLHSLLCEAPNHKNSCDYYVKESEEGKKWVVVVEERMEVLGFSAEQLYLELSTIPIVLSRNLSQEQLRLTAWLVNRIAERAPRCLAAAVDCSVEGVLPSVGEADFPRRL